MVADRTASPFESVTSVFCSSSSRMSAPASTTVTIFADANGVSLGRRVMVVSPPSVIVVGSMKTPSLRGVAVALAAVLAPASFSARTSKV